MVDDLYSIGDDGSIVLSVHASPGAGRSAVVGRHGDAVKIRVAAPPEQGRANDALVALLAEEFGLEPAHVELVGGPSSRAKRFRLTGLDPDDFPRLLERVMQPDAGPGRAARDRRGPTF